MDPMAYITLLGFVIFAICSAYVKYEDDKKYYNRKFTYVKEAPPRVVYVPVKEYIYVDRIKEVAVPSPEVKTNKQEKETIKQPINEKLKEEAVNFLTSMGEKKKAATEKVLNMFNDKAYNNIEEFVLDFYRR